MYFVTIYHQLASDGIPSEVVMHFVPARPWLTRIDTSETADRAPGVIRSMPVMKGVSQTLPKVQLWQTQSTAEYPLSMPLSRKGAEILV